MTLPQGFIDLAQAHGSSEGSLVSIIGTVADVLPPAITRTGEHMITFKLLDLPLSNNVIGSEGLKVRFFVKDSSNLPKVRNVGDIVLLRKIKMSMRDGQRIAVNNYQTGLLVFPSSGIPNPNFSIGYLDKQKLECFGVEQMKNSLTIGEQQYVIVLKQETGRLLQERSEEAQRLEEKKAPREINKPEEPPVKRQKSTNSFGPKFRLVEELQPRTFADLCGKVVKTISAGYGGNDLYITDYTSNDQMRYYSSPEEVSDEHRDGDDFGYGDSSKKAWPGPYEQTVLKVNVKPPHAAYANRMLGEGDWVLLRNVKMRTTDILKLEGDMWPDYLNPERVQVQKLMNHDMPEIQAILRREEKYWNARNAKLKTNSKGEQKVSRREKKRRNKQAKEELQRRIEALEQEKTEITSKKTKNPHVRCNYEEIAATKVKDILDVEGRKHTATLPDGRFLVLPFVNVKYRAKVRVVDFEPKVLEDFAVQPEPDDNDSIDSMAWQYDTPRYEWSFSLLLEDTSTKPSGQDAERMWVQVHHAEAQFLLGNDVPDPGNLQHDSQLLAKLREKLFVLWGNLEEKGGKELSNLPFECCIQEYGVELEQQDLTSGLPAHQGWQRMYSMFGATIL